jgi:hypothetical protein
MLFSYPQSKVMKDVQQNSYIIFACQQILMEITCRQVEGHIYNMILLIFGLLYTSWYKVQTLWTCVMI